MLTYAILQYGNEEPLGYIRCADRPSLEAMADHLASGAGFPDRDDYLALNPGLMLGCDILH
jgi:hypothetical protein